MLTALCQVLLGMVTFPVVLAMTFFGFSFKGADAVIALADETVASVDLTAAGDDAEGGAAITEADMTA